MAVSCSFSCWWVEKAAENEAELKLIQQRDRQVEILPGHLARCLMGYVWNQPQICACKYHVQTHSSQFMWVKFIFGAVSQHLFPLLINLLGAKLIPWHRPNTWRPLCNQELLVPFSNVLYNCEAERNQWCRGGCSNWAKTSGCSLCTVGFLAVLFRGSAMTPFLPP